jgi:hypothetical protein
MVYVRWSQGGLNSGNAIGFSHPSPPLPKLSLPFFFQNSVLRMKNCKISKLYMMDHFLNSHMGTTVYALKWVGTAGYVLE